MGDVDVLRIFFFLTAIEVGLRTCLRDKKNIRQWW